MFFSVLCGRGDLPSSCALSISLILYCLVTPIKILLIVYKAIIYRDFLNAVAIVMNL